MDRNQRIINILIKTIETKYKNDIAMLVLYGNKKTSNDGNEGVELYFIPSNDRGRELSCQFIVEGVSYDVFPMRWERLIANAAMDSPQAYLLLDTEILYCANDEALHRFQQLKSSVSLLLGGEYDEALINKAYEYFNESYIYLYNMLTFKDLGTIRLEAGKLLNKIATALGFANRSYNSNGNGSVLRDSFDLEELPRDYSDLVDSILFATAAEEVSNKCLELVHSTRDFLLNKKKAHAQEESFDTLFVGYYEELKKSINKCQNAVEHNDYYKLYELCSYMQEEVGQFIAKAQEGVWYDDRNAFIDYGLHFTRILGVDLLEAVASRDDHRIMKTIQRFEDNLIALIEENNVKLLMFSSVDQLESYFIEKQEI